jgi:hypothetical protein
MDNRKCIPDTNDHAQQRENYVNLMERIMVKNIPCMEFFGKCGDDAYSPSVQQGNANKVKNGKCLNTYQQLTM